MKLKNLKKKYAETWQENETSIVLKMLGKSVKERDEGKIQELERYLLTLEHKSDSSSSGEEESSPTSLKQATSLVEARSKSFLSPHGSESGESSLTDPGNFSPSELAYLKKAIRQNTKQYDMQINIMIVGNTFTGKTSLMSAMLGEKGPQLSRPTLG
ncbi:MAG: hypothetical protein P4M11_00005 [Candidatus Pacebacteria bacterium]|nr:hypothetical protein [Candidatus Paceibacterota bacterium]